MNESQVKCKTCFFHRINTIVVIIKLSYLSLGCNTKVVRDHNSLNNCGFRIFGRILCDSSKSEIENPQSEIIIHQLFTSGLRK
jgi:hypothetical protein